MKKIIFIIFCLAFTIHQGFCQSISGSLSPVQMSKPKLDDLKTGGVAGDVNIFNGTFNTSYSLGTVHSPGGLKFDVNLTHSSIYSVANTMPFLDGVPFGQGWNVDLPSITVSNEDYHKFTTKELETMETAGGYNPAPPCGGNNHAFTPRYTTADMNLEGKTFWFAPELNIPGVASGKLIYKGKKYRSGDVIVHEFILQTFESFIIAELAIDGNNWNVYLPDGTKYFFYLQDAALGTASNRRNVVETQGQADLKNLVYPQTITSKWYVTSIINYNGTDAINFSYRGFGRFNNIDNYINNGVNEYALQPDRLFKGKITPANISSSEVFLDSISSGSEVIVFNYKTHNLGGNELLKLNGLGVTRFDSLYSTKNVVRWNTTPAGGSIGFANHWYLNRHVKNDHPNQYDSEQNDTELPPMNNPYSILSGVLGCYISHRETVGTDIMDYGMKFYYYPGKSGFLESERVKNEIYKGDTYKVVFNVNSNSQSHSLLDINIGTGDNKYPLSTNITGLIYTTCYNRANGESLYSTFDKANKFVTSGYNNEQFTACFNMPNQPSEYDGFTIQIGPANSDVDYSKTPISLANGTEFPQTPRAYYPYDLNNNCFPDYDPTNNFWSRSGSPVSRNFGIGLPWDMMVDYYKNMYPDNFDFSSPVNWFWWKKTGQGQNINKAIATKADVRINDVTLSRISKNTYVLDNVQKFVRSVENGSRTATEQLKFSYELKSVSLYTATQKYYTSPSSPEDVKSYVGGTRHIVLLRGIRVFPSNALQTVNYASNPTAPTTTFYYGKKSEMNALDSYFYPDYKFSGLLTNSTVFTIDSFSNPLGQTTLLTYNPIQNAFKYSIGLNNNLYYGNLYFPVSPIDSSYMISRDLYVKKYKEGSSSDACSGCGSVDRRDGYPPYSYQLYLTVKEKKVIDKTAAKVWRYKYSAFGTRNTTPPLPDQFTEDVHRDISPGYGLTKVMRYDNGNPLVAIDTTLYYSHRDFARWGKTYAIIHKTNGGNLISSKQIKWKVTLAYESAVYRVNYQTGGNSIYAEYANGGRPSRSGVFGSANQSYYTALDTYLSGDFGYHNFFTFPLNSAFGPEYYHTKFFSNTLYSDVNNSFFLRADTIIDTEYPTSGSPIINYVINTYTINTYYDADHKGIPISTSAYTTLLGSSYIAGTRLFHEPSWGLASTKVYSTELPGVSRKTENFYVYDLINKTNYVNVSDNVPLTILNILKKVALTRYSLLPHETRVTSVGSGTTHVQSTYYTYKFITGANDAIGGNEVKKMIPGASFLVLDSITQQIDSITLQPQKLMSFNVSTGKYEYPEKIRLLTRFLTYDDFTRPRRTQDMTNILRGVGYNYHGDILKDTFNVYSPLALITTNTYDNYCRLTTSVDPNGTSFGFSYDYYNRVITKLRNGVNTQAIAYNNWTFAPAQSYYERSKQNYITTTDYITGALNTVSKSMIDPSGRSILTNTNTVAYDRTEYDIFDRISYKVKPYSPIGADPLQMSAPGVNEKMEYTYEAAPRNRVLKASKYGENIAGANVMLYGYQNLLYNNLIGNAAGCGQTNTGLLPGAGSIYNVTSVTDEDGKLSQTYLDAVGRKIVEIAGSNYAMTIYKYDERGNIMSVSNPKNQQTDYVYNYLNHLFSSTSPDEGYTSYAYDRKGRLVAERNSKDEVRVYKYDDFNRMILQARTTYGAAVALFSLQGLDWLTDNAWGTTYSNLLTSATPEKKWRYDDYDASLNTSYQPNATPYLNLSKSNTKGRLTQTYSYNNAGGLVELKWFSYNADGFLKWEMTQMNDVAIAPASKGRLFRIDYPEYTIDGKVLTKNVDLNGDHKLDLQYYYVYDNFGRMSEIWSHFKNLKNAATGNKVVLYQYDNIISKVLRKHFYQSKAACYNNILTETDSYGYDQRFRLTSFGSNTLNWAMYYGANNPVIPPPGAVTSTNYNGNINATVATYNFAGATNGAIPLFNPAVTYTYSYDALNRLDLADATNVTGGGGGLFANVGDEDPGYDKIGNFSQIIRGLNNAGVFTYPTYTYTYNVNTNRLANTAIGGVIQRSMTYDNTGNMNAETVGAATNNFTYGRSNLPFTVTSGATTVNYLYGTDDNRIIRVNSTQAPSKDYIIRSMDGQELANYKSGEQLITWYVQGHNREVKFNHFATLGFDDAAGNTAPANGYGTDPFLIAITDPVTTAYPDPDYYAMDHLGNAHVVYKMNYNCQAAYLGKTIQYAADFYAFGKLVREYVNPGVTSEKFKFTEKERDAETGLDYFGARYYSSEVGRFASVDPLAEKYSSWSGYNYVKNNPIRLIDPDGMAAQDIIIGKGIHDNDYRRRVLNNLQSLSNDKLAISPQGVVSIIERLDGEQSKGTNLIRTLIEGYKKNDGTHVEYDVNITDDIGGLDMDLKTNSGTISISKTNASNGIGSSSSIYIDVESEGFITDQNGKKIVSEDKYRYAHELLHSLHNALGIRKFSENKTYLKNDEELNTVIEENEIREENGSKTFRKIE